MLIDISKQNKQLIQSVVKTICDGGYAGVDYKKQLKDTFDIDLEITQRTDIANGIVSKIRWISERSFAWIEKCRRLFKNVEGSFRNSKSMVVLVFIRLLCRRLEN